MNKQNVHRRRRYERQPAILSLMTETESTQTDGKPYQPFEEVIRMPGESPKSGVANGIWPMPLLFESLKLRVSYSFP